MGGFLEAYPDKVPTEKNERIILLALFDRRANHD